MSVFHEELFAELAWVRGLLDAETRRANALHWYVTEALKSLHQDQPEDAKVFLREALGAEILDG
ncbi:MAG: hypothetical protein H0W82_02250 [Actinobacteria bacterium]|nr:hypothetical protein [Actinomycetota bacterium]